MAIAKPHKDNSKAIEKKASDFINGVAEKPKNSEIKIPLMIRLDKSILEEIDGICAAKGMKRSPWIQYKLSEILKRGE